MKPPPPMLPARGRVTASAKPTATAASTALPPSRKTSSPTRDAAASWVTTMPCFATTGTAVAKGEMTGGGSAAAITGAKIRQTKAARRKGCKAVELPKSSSVETPAAQAPQDEDFYLNPMTS